RTGAPAIVTLDGDRNVNSLTISNPNQYIIAQGTGGTLRIISEAGIHILRGSHIISASLTLKRFQDNAPPSFPIEVLADSQLTISGPLTISSLGNAFKSGGGTLILSNIVLAPGLLYVREGQVRFDGNAGTSATATNPAMSNLSIIASRNGA